MSAWRPISRLSKSKHEPSAVAAIQIARLHYPSGCREGCGNQARLIFRFLDRELHPVGAQELCLLHAVAAEKAAKVKRLRVFRSQH